MRKGKIYHEIFTFAILFALVGSILYMGNVMLVLPQSIRVSHNYAIFHNISTSRSDADIIITEIMYDPDGLDTLYEWLEIYNIGTTSVNLSGWQLYDSGTLRSMNLVSGDYILWPNEYAIIARNATAFMNYYPWYNGTIFNCTSMTLANTADTIGLYNGTLFDIVSYNYSWGGGTNYSMELIDYYIDNNVSSNWNTTKVYGGTPGYKNTISPPVIIYLSYDTVVLDNTNAVIRAKVDDHANITSVNIYYRYNATPPFYSNSMVDNGSNGDTVADDGEYSYMFPILPADTVVEFYVEAINVSGQRNTYPWRAPELLKNFTIVSSSYPNIVINEFMPDPANDWDGNGVYDYAGDEYIELYNNDSIIVDLGGWILDDIEDGGSSPYTIPPNTIINPGEVIVFFGSTTGIGLNNGGDSVRLLTQYGILVDIYNYTSSADDIAYGRMPDGMGWTLLDTPSPGRLNAVTSALSINWVTRIPSTPTSGEVVSITTNITHVNPLTAVKLNYSVNHGAEQAIDMILYNGNYTCTIGPFNNGDSVEYYVFCMDTENNIEKSQNYSFNVVDYSVPVVINEFLPNPGSDWDGDGNATYKDEFIELYNPTANTIDLSGWYIDDEDGGSAPYQLPQGTTIGPYGYLVIFEIDSNVALNNNGDCVRLLDPMGNEYLNVSYSYYSNKDVSIGLYPDGNHTWDYRNLTIPTPGANNTPPLGSIPTISNVHYDPEYPLSHSNITIYATIVADYPVIYARLHWVFWDRSEVEDMVLVDNNTWSVTLPAMGQEGNLYYYIEASTVYGTGYYPTNATTGGRELIHIYAEAPYSPYSHLVVINEVMFNPLGDEAVGEWIEIYNNGTESIDMVNFSITDQDGDDTDYVFPDISLAPGEYIVLHIGKGNDTYRAGVWHLYCNSSVSILTNSGDDLVLYDNNGYGVDYIAYGNSYTVDPPPIGLSWKNTPTNLPDEGYTLSLVPNGYDVDDGIYWRGSYPTPGQENAPLPDMGPKIEFIGFKPSYPKANDTVSIAVDITDDNLVIDAKIYYRIFGYGTVPATKYNTLRMIYNGTYYVGNVTVNDNCSVLEFYITATDNAMNTTRYPDNDTIKILITDFIPQVSINEILPKPGSDWNQDGDTNSGDEYIEIYNPGPGPVDIGGWQVDDIIDGGSDPYIIPYGTILDNGGFYLIYRSESGVSLNDNGDNVTLIGRNGEIRHTISYNSSSSDVSIGMYPDGSGNIYELPAPTPGYENAKPFIPVPPTSMQRRLLITKIYYRENNDYDFVAIFNPNEVSIDISYFYLDDGEGYIQIPPNVSIAPWDELYVAINSTAFNERMHFLPDIALNVFDEGVFKASGNGFNLANNGDNIALLSQTKDYIDVVAFGNVDYIGIGWTGSPTRNAKSGEVLVRIRVDSHTYQDTNTSADWEGLRRYFIGQSDFTPLKITFNGTVEAFVSPDSSFQVITNAIDNAQYIILINVYQFTNWEIAKHIISALNRGVRVYMYLAGTQVGGMSNEEKYCLNEIHKAGGRIRFMASNVAEGIISRYRYNHAKYCVIDNQTVILTSENWKYSGIPPDPTYGNRGWGIKIDNPALAEYYANVFFTDFDDSWGDSFDFGYGDFGPPPEDYVFVPSIPKGNYDQYFKSLRVTSVFGAETVLAPDTTLLLNDGILGMIKRAKKTIYIEQLDADIEWGQGVDYTFNWDYKEGYYLQWEDGKEYYNIYLTAIIDAARRGVKVRILLDSLYANPYSKEMDNFDTAVYINKIAEIEGLDMEAKLVDLGKLGLEKIHAKGIVVDNESVLVSSINFGPNAAIYNRESGIIITHETIAKYYATVFLSDYGYGNTTPTDIEPGETPSEQTGDDEGGIPAFEVFNEGKLPELSNEIILTGAAIIFSLWIIILISILYHAIIRRDTKTKKT